MNEEIDLSNPALIERWLQWKALNEGRAEATIDKYRRILHRLAAHLGKPMITATQEELSVWVGAKLHAEGLRPRSRRIAVAAMRGFYRWLMTLRVIDRDPSAGIPTPRFGMALPYAMQIKHAEALLMQPDLSTFIGLRDAAIIAVLAGTGCRVSGVTALNEGSLLWSLDPKSNTERLDIRFVEKGKKERIVPAPFEAALFIRAYLGHEDLATIDRSLPNGDRVLFVGTQSSRVPAHEYHGERRRLHRRTILGMFYSYGESAGLPRAVCHPHALRHMVGTEMAEHDIDLIQRAAILGHARPETTQVYTHLAMRKLRGTMDTINPLGQMETPMSAIARELRAGKGRASPKAQAER